MKKALSLSFLLFSFAACGDNNDNNNPRPDAPMQDMPDAPIDAPEFVAPTPVAIPLSADGPDVLMSAAPGPNGSFYAAGYAAATFDGNKMVVVVRLTSTGALDSSFGTDGVYTSNLVFKGGNDEIDVAVQSDGKVVVAATIANDLEAADKDIGLFRVDASGDLDTTFGTLGFSRVNLSNAHDTDAGAGVTLAALDAQRGLAIGPSDQIFIHATSRDMADDATTPRTDTDFTVARLTANGILDAANYGTGGKFLLDFEGNISKANATPRGIAVLSDGTVIAGGYATTTAFTGAQPVLYRLTPAGALDDTNWSANGGVFYDGVLGKQTEIYNFAIDGDRITTAGYGRDTDTAGAAEGCCNYWVSMRFDVSDGTRDTSFGGATAGVVAVDPSAATVGDNCRNAVGLPGGKTALLGSAGGTGERDAALAILTQNGALDTTYGTGVHTFSLDGTEDQWWGGAVNNGRLMLVGWKGVGSTQTDVANDNSYAVVLELQ